MKNHLLEAVHDLKLEGKAEQEAVEIAIKRFGKETELRSVISQIFKVQKTFSKWVLYSGLAILLISAAAFGIFLNIGNDRVSEQSEIAYAIRDIVQNDAGVSQASEGKIKELLSGADYIEKVTVYRIGNRNKNPIYELDRTTGKNPPLVYNDFSYGGDGNSVVELQFLDYRDIGFLTMFFGVVCFGILFIIWAIINIYNKKRKAV